MQNLSWLAMNEESVEQSKLIEKTIEINLDINCGKVYISHGGTFFGGKK